MIARQLEQDFKDSVSKYNATKFDYKFDPLTPQESYFVGTKLKFLKFRHGPELGTIQFTVYFDLQTDSVVKFIRRDVLKELNKSGTDVTGRLNDTLYVSTFDPVKTLTYANNKIVDSTAGSVPVKNQWKFLYRMKHFTEEQYKKRN